MKQDYILTMDLDWCPDWILVEVLSDLREIPITLFMTHQSEWLSKQISLGAKWSLGIHPNFEPNSTHGEIPEKIFSDLLGDFPNAMAWRAHSLLTSNRVMQNWKQFNQLKVISNTYDPYFKMQSIGIEQFLLRSYLNLPIHFEDDLAMVDDLEFERSIQLMKNKQSISEIVNLSFHPVHLFLNSSNMNMYNQLRSQIYSDQPPSKDIQKNPGLGVSDLFAIFMEMDPNLCSIDELASRYPIS